MSASYHDVLFQIALQQRVTMVGDAAPSPPSALTLHLLAEPPQDPELWLKSVMHAGQVPWQPTVDRVVAVVLDEAAFPMEEATNMLDAARTLYRSSASFRRAMESNGIVTLWLDGVGEALWEMTTRGQRVAPWTPNEKEGATVLRRIVQLVRRHGPSDITIHAPSLGWDGLFVLLPGLCMTGLERHRILVEFLPGEWLDFTRLANALTLPNISLLSWLALAHVAWPFTAAQIPLEALWRMVLTRNTKLPSRQLGPFHITNVQEAEVADCMRRVYLGFGAFPVLGLAGYTMQATARRRQAQWLAPGPDDPADPHQGLGLRRSRGGGEAPLPNYGEFDQVVKACGQRLAQTIL